MFSWRLVLLSWVIASIFLLAYSFTQIDLSLTLSQASFWQVIQKNFQHIGYFQRPLSTYFFVGIVLLFSILYLLTLKLSFTNKITLKSVLVITFVVSLILFFSYNAFSYDFFNYIFDAKIFTHYNKDPYQFRALDFPGEPMLSFMRSTHRVYPYGPSWLWTTIPLSFIGFNYFLLTFYLFKALVVGSFVGSVWFLNKILKEVRLEKPSFALALFALNPLVLIESVVSAHNDIVMVFLALGSLYFLIRKKYLFAIVFLLLSIGIKFATILLVPFFLFVIIQRLRKKELNFQNLFYSLFLVMLVAVFFISFASGQNKNPEFQPWYLLIMLPFVAFTKTKIVKAVAIGVSIGALFSYVPYLYNGEWPYNIVRLKNIMLLVSSVIGVMFYFTFEGIGRLHFKKKLFPTKE